MKQLTIEVFDNKKSWGVKNITLLAWQNTHINYIEIDWYSTDRDTMPMYLDNDGITFKNSHGNLFGTIKY